MKDNLVEKLRAKRCYHPEEVPYLVNPDGPEAAARIEKLAEVGAKLRRIGDDKMATRREWTEACREWDALTSTREGLTGGEA